MAVFDFPGYYSNQFYSAGYFDTQQGFLGHIVAYSPASGSTVDVGTRPVVVFDQSINSGTILFTLTQSGGINVPGISQYNPATSIDVFIPNSQLAFSSMYTALVSGQDVQGSFIFSWPFFTAQSGHHHPRYNIILTLPGKLTQPTYQYQIIIDNLKQLKVLQ